MRERAQALRRWWAEIGTQNQIAIAVPLIVAAIGAGVAVGISGADPFSQSNQARSVPGAAQRGARIVIDGLSVEDTNGGAQIVDVQVRNAGDRIAYIHTVKFKILAMRDVPFCPLASPVRSSYTYEVAFPDASRSPPIVVEKRVDQAIEGDDVDRFRIMLGNPKGGLGSTLYRANLDLIYNQGLSTKPESVIVGLEGFWEAAGYTITGDSQYLQCLRELARNVLAITRLSGERSPSVRRLRPEARRLGRDLREKRRTQQR